MAIYRTGGFAIQRNEPILTLATIVPALAWHRHRDADARSTAGIRWPDLDPAFTHLTEVYEFGTNPGALRMFKYVPAVLARANSALVVVLHGCTQSAAGYDLGAGWSTMADRYGFALLLPQQQVSNNPNNGFNWFLPGDIERGRGEALSIRQMIETMFISHRID